MPEQIAIAKPFPTRAVQWTGDNPGTVAAFLPLHLRAVMKESPLHELRIGGALVRKNDWLVVIHPSSYQVMNNLHFHERYRVVPNPLLERDA